MTSKPEMVGGSRRPMPDHLALTHPQEQEIQTVTNSENGGRDDGTLPAARRREENCDGRSEARLVSGGDIRLDRKSVV